MTASQPYRDRRHAGMLLRRVLRRRGVRAPFVVAIGRGGVPVGREIRDELGGVLTMLAVKKVTDASGRTLGAVASDGTAYLHEDVVASAGIERSDIENSVSRAAEVAAGEQATYADRWSAAMSGRPLILVDDAVATGATAAAAIGAVRKVHPSLVIFATPLATVEGIELIRSMADELVSSHSTQAFQRLEAVYADYAPVSNAELRAALQGPWNHEAVHE